MSLPSPDISVTSPTQQQREVGKNVAQNLNQMGHAVLSDQVIAHTGDTPINETPEMAQAGASIFSRKDLADVVGAALANNGETGRQAPTSMFLRILNSKLKGQSKP